MPLMDGFETTKYIKKIDNNIPIIALSANAMKEDIELTRELGMNEHLSKPIDVDKLYATLLKYISHKDLNETKDKEEAIVIPEFKYIDSKVGLAYMNNDKNLYIKILKNFYYKYNDLDIVNIKDEEFMIVVHTIKGLSANIGAIELNKLACDINESQDISCLDALHVELKKVLLELRSLFINEKDITPQVSNEFASRTKVDELFSKLIEALKTKRPKNCEVVFVEFRNLKLNSNDKSLYQSVEKLINHYKFADAIKLLEG